MSNWRDEPATPRQISYLKKLGCALHPDQKLTKGEASDLIEKLQPEEDREYFRSLDEGKAITITLDIPKIFEESRIAVDLDLWLYEWANSHPPLQEWERQPATAEQWNDLRLFTKINPQVPLTTAQAEYVIKRVSEELERQRWEKASESERKQILRDKYTASYLHEDYEKAKQAVNAASQGKPKEEMADAELDAPMDAEDSLNEAEEERANFWRATFSEKDANTLDQSYELHTKYGYRFKIPTKKQIIAILEALDSASVTWDKENPELFYETLKLNFPDQRRKAKSGS